MIFKFMIFNELKFRILIILYALCLKKLIVGAMKKYERTKTHMKVRVKNDEGKYKTKWIEKPKSKIEILIIFTLLKKLWFDCFISFKYFFLNDRVRTGIL